MNDPPPAQGESLTELIRLAAEWNAEIRKRNWPTNQWYWKMHATRSFGRWKYHIHDEEEAEGT